MRCRLAPSPFFSSLLALKEAKERMRSTTPQLATFLQKVSGRSHLEPKEEARRVRVSLVCGRRGEERAGGSRVQLATSRRAAGGELGRRGRPGAMLQHVPSWVRTPQGTLRPWILVPTCESNAGFSIRQLTNTHR